MKHAIFISYRRDDAEGEAGRLYDDLVRTYGDNSVFMDVAGIAPGLDFRNAIDDNVSGCGVFLAIIGSQWATIADSDGKRRLDDANDFVRLEIASALARNIAVIPVLVHEARMPHPDQLPDNIKDLAYRNSVEISHVRWNSDVQLLIAALKQYVTTSTATETQPVHATVPVQLPPPVSTDPPVSPPPSRLPWIVGGIAVALVLAVIGYFVARPSPSNDVTKTPPAPQEPGPERANVLTGVWRNTDAKKGGDSLITLRIDGPGPAYHIEPIGECPQGECSWGSRSVTLNGGAATGVWTPQNTPQEISQKRTVTLTLQPLDGKLNVQVRNTFWPDAKSKPRSNDLQYVFEREP
ncbi:MAG: toll/interleukin-1 receptor domain-containing protein [Silvibacterium sp.]